MSGTPPLQLGAICRSPQTAGAGAARLARYDARSERRHGADARSRNTRGHRFRGAHRRCRIPAPGRQRAARAALSPGRHRTLPGGGAGAWRRLGAQGPHRQRFHGEGAGRERHPRRLARFPDAARGGLPGLARRHQSRHTLAEGARAQVWQPAGLGRHVRHVERRPPGAARGDAPGRPALRGAAIARGARISMRASPL